MFCTNCGKKLEEGGAFCPNCGTAVEQVAQNVSETPVQEPEVQVSESAAEVQLSVTEPSAAPAEAEVSEVAEEPAAVEVAEEPAAVAETAEVAFEAPAEPKESVFKKIGQKLYKLRWALGVGIPVLAAAAFVFFNWNWLTGFAVKTFGTPAEYFAYAESASLKDTVADFSTIYGSLLGSSAKTDGIGMRGEVSVSMGDYMRSMLAMSGMNMDWLNEVSMSIDTNINQNNAEYSFDLAVSGEEIVRVHVILDTENRAVYMGLPGLNDTYVKMDLSALEMDEAAMAELEEYLAAMEEAMASLPSEEEISEILNRYIDIIIENIDTAEQKSTDLTVDGVTQAVTEVVVKVDARMVSKILKAVLTEARNDQQIKDILSALSELVAEELDGVDIVAQYETMIDELLSSYAEVPDEANTVLFVLHDYIDSDHDVIGRKVIMGEETVFYYAMVVDGGDMAFLLESEGEPLLRGEGTKDGDEITGTFDILAYGESVFSFDVKDLNLSQLADGKASGQIRFDLSAAVGSSMDMVISFDITPDDVEMTVAMLMGGSELMAISMEFEITDGRAVTLPANAVPAVDEQGLAEWAEGIDMNELLSRLQEAGLSDLIESLMGGSLDEF